MSETPERREIVRTYARRRDFMVAALRALTHDGPEYAYDDSDARRFFGWERIALFRQLFNEHHGSDERTSTWYPDPSELTLSERLARRHPDASPPPPNTRAVAGALRALTPDGTLADLYLGKAFFWPREAVGTHMWTLLREDRPDLAGWARDWTALDHESLIIPVEFTRTLDDEVTAELRALGQNKPSRPVGKTDEKLLAWTSRVVHLASQNALFGAILESLVTLTETATGKHANRRYFPLVRQVRAATMSGAGMFRSPEPVELDDDAIARLPDHLDKDLEALTLEDLTALFRLIGAMLRNRLIELEDVTLPARAALPDPDLIGDAVAAAFPMWNERLEREVLPLTRGRFDTLVARCDDVPASPEALEFTRAMAWRSLTRLCIDPVRDDTPTWLVHLTKALEAREGVDDLTALVVGLELYCAGFAAHGASIWRTRIDMDVPF